MKPGSCPGSNAYPCGHLLALTAAALCVRAAAAVEVKVGTCAWHPDGSARVKTARTQDDDSEAMRKMAEPVIVDAAMTEMTRRGLTLTDEKTIKNVLRRFPPNA